MNKYPFIEKANHSQFVKPASEANISSIYLKVNFKRKMSAPQQFRLGTRGYHLFVNEYNGEPKIHIRKIYEDPVDGRPIITKYGITLSLNEWDDLKHYFQEADRQLMNLSRQASTRKAPAVSGQVKCQRTTPYQRFLIMKSTNQNNSTEVARNDTIIKDTASPTTFDELFNGTLQDY